MKVKEMKLSVTTCYLVETDNKYILIDTGYAYDWELFQKRLKEADVALSDISHLVLTHHHDDHCGLVNMILKNNEDIRIVMSSQAREFLARGENDRTHIGRYVSRRAKLLFALLQRLDKRFAEQWRTHRFPPYVSRESDILVEGEATLDEVGIGLCGRVVETPGHTTDSISVLLEDGSCFAGDAASNLPQIAGAKYCVVIVEDIDEYYKTWRKLVSAGASRIYPAHGGSFPAAKLGENMGKIKPGDLVPLA